MMAETLVKIERKMLKTTLQSHVITHARLKHFSSISHMSEDQISRIALGISIRIGLEVDDDWKPGDISSDLQIPVTVITQKALKGQTMFQSDFPLFVAMIKNGNEELSYEECRKRVIFHWERGVEKMVEIADGETDWIEIVSKLVSWRESIS